MEQSILVSFYFPIPSAPNEYFLVTKGKAVFPEPVFVNPLLNQICLILLFLDLRKGGGHRIL